MSHANCSHFRANFWRPTTCAYCYRSRGKHRNQPVATDIAAASPQRNMQDRHAAKEKLRGRTLTLHRVSKSSTSVQNSEESQRSATLGASSPTLTRERKQKSEPPPEERQVGVVKPYAIVELNESWAKKNKAKFSLLKEPAVYTHSESIGRSCSDGQQILSPPPLLYPRVASAGLLLPDRPGSSLASVGRRNLIPKRKAPPPPPQDKEKCRRPKRSNSVPPSVMSATLTRMFSSQQSVGVCNATDHPEWSSRGRAKTASSHQLHIEQLPGCSSTSQPTSPWREKELSPPRKPPRTQSTFVSDIVGNGGDFLGARSGLISAEQCISPANDYEPLRRLPFAHASEQKQKDGYLVHQPLSLLQRMLETLDNGLRSIAETQLKDLVPPEQLWDLRWSDIIVCTQEDRSHQFYYRLRPLSVEALLDTCLMEMRISRNMGPHLNLDLIQGCLPEAPLDVLDIVPPAIQYAIRDSPPSNVLLSELLPLWQADLNEEEYEQCVLMTVLQVFRGLRDLYNNGVVHRDLGLDSLCVQTHQGNSIIKICHFQYALHRPGPLSATSFIYAFHELKWLGGADSKLPPEIMDTPNNVQTLDYAHSDCFAAGCLLYELLLGENPFERDSNLVYSQYKEADLPTCTGHSTTTTHLFHLARLLLRRDPANRINISDALLILQTILWLPKSWLDSVADMEEVRERLSLMKASLMSQLANRICRNESAPLELLLKAEFLSMCSPTELMRTLAVFRQ